MMLSGDDISIPDWKQIAVSLWELSFQIHTNLQYNSSLSAG